MDLEKRYKELLEFLHKEKRVVTAYSGGVDSTLLAYASNEALGKNAYCVTIQTPYIPLWELKEAQDFAKEKQFQHQVIKLGIPKEIEENDALRCYHCKKVLFTEILQFAKNKGETTVLDGTNADDSKDYRPGLKALKELSIVSPFQKLGWDKKLIRDVSQFLNLPTHSKPAYACLLSRIPYGEVIKESVFRKVEKSELFLMKLGFSEVRVRIHGNIARIEVPQNRKMELMEREQQHGICETIQSYGFAYVCLDLQGYRMGSLNETLSTEVLNKVTEVN